MSEVRPITAVVTDLYNLLDPLNSPDRQKALQAALALLGEVVVQPKRNEVADRQTEVFIQHMELGPTATKWITQNKIPQDAIENLFHVDANGVIPIFSAVPGASMREQTVSCYLLEGVRSLLQTDEARVDDRAAVELCQQVGAYDRNNHTANRTSLGARMAGSRANGFNLTVPGLRDAARLVKSMGTNNSEE